MTDHDDNTWGLVLPFDSDDTEFCRGFEAGALYANLAADPGVFHQQVHATNAEMVLRIAETHGRAVRTISEVDDWLEVEFGEAQ